MRETMNSLNSSGFKSPVNRSPKVAKEDIERKQMLIEKINQNRREMSSMSQQVAQKKNELLALRETMSQFRGNTPKKDVF